MTNNVRLPLLATPADEPVDSVESVAVADASIPAGERMQIGDLARESGKTVRAIHLYEELNLLHPAGRSKGRYRLYGPEALMRIRWIGKLQEMGFSLTDIQTVVRDWEQQATAPRMMVKMREVYAKKLAETRAHLQRLQALEHEIEASLSYLNTCDTCEPARLIAACNSCDHHDARAEVPELVAGFRARTSAI
jgi:DNA-binding transcriptional MerR regulator